MKIIVISVMWTIIGAALHSVWSDWKKRREVLNGKEQRRAKHSGDSYSCRVG